MKKKRKYGVNFLKILAWAILVALGACAPQLMVPGERYRVQNCRPAYDRIQNKAGWHCRCQSTLSAQSEVRLFVADSLPPGSELVLTIREAAPRLRPKYESQTP